MQETKSEFSEKERNEEKRERKEEEKKKGKGDKREGNKSEVFNVGCSEMEILDIFKSGHLNTLLKT